MADPLVLLPGLMSDARVFWPQIAELSAKTAVTVAPITDLAHPQLVCIGMLFGAHHLTHDNAAELAGNRDDCIDFEAHHR